MWSRHTHSSEIQTEQKVSFAVFRAHKIQSHDHETGSSPVIFLKTNCTAKFQFLIHNISFTVFITLKACNPLDMNKGLFYPPVFLHSLYMHFNVAYHVNGLPSVIFHIPLFSNSIIISTSQSFTYHCNRLRCTKL